LLHFHQIILRQFLSLFLALFIIIGAIVYYWVYEYYLESSKNALLQDVELIALNIHQETNLDILVEEIKSKLNLRITIINQDGQVLAESHEDKKRMENHKYRDEIIQARQKSYGYKVRHSHTMDKNFLYVAKMYTFKNRTLYIRLATKLKSVRKQVFTLATKTLSVLIIFFIAIFIITYKINTQLKNETEKILSFLKSLTKKKKMTYITSTYSQEFVLITKLLTKVSHIIVKKEKQKLRYTKRLEDSNQQKDDIISAISHEFKNPIAVVNGYSQTLLDDEDINPKIRHKFLSKILKNGTRLSELINTLRLSMKLDGGQQSIDKSKKNIYNLVKESSDTLKSSYTNREVVITGNRDLEIELDGTLFSIVISNLLENAFKYSEDEVIINITENSFEVIDTGIGISHQHIQNITDKFYRVNQNSWNNSLGLGLFLVKNITKLHDFTLNIQSKENEGSTFSIIF